MRIAKGPGQARRAPRRRGAPVGPRPEERGPAQRLQVCLQTMQQQPKGAQQASSRKEIARPGSAPRRSRRTLECGMQSRAERLFSESLSHGAGPGSAPRRASANPAGNCLCTRAAAPQRYRKDGPPASGANSRRPLPTVGAANPATGAPRPTLLLSTWGSKQMRGAFTKRRLLY